MLDHFMSNKNDCDRFEKIIRNIPNQEEDGKLIVLVGNGANGKTTFIHALTDAVFEVTEDPESPAIVTPMSMEKETPAMMKTLMGRGLNYIYETNDMNDDAFLNTKNDAWQRRIVPFTFDHTFTTNDTFDATSLKDYFKALMKESDNK